jgi:hypothetical protein
MGAALPATEPGWTKPITGGLRGVGARTWCGKGDRSDKSLSKSEWVGRVGMPLLTSSPPALHSRGRVVLPVRTAMAQLNKPPPKSDFWPSA